MKENEPKIKPPINPEEIVNSRLEYLAKREEPVRRKDIYAAILQDDIKKFEQLVGAWVPSRANPEHDSNPGFLWPDGTKNQDGTSALAAWKKEAEGWQKEN